MPKYDFVCMNCDSSVEMLEVTDSHSKPGCVKCGEFMTKVHTPPSVSF